MRSDGFVEPDRLSQRQDRRDEGATTRPAVPEAFTGWETRHVLADRVSDNSW